MEAKLVQEKCFVNKERQKNQSKTKIDKKAHRYKELEDRHKPKKKDKDQK